MNNNISNIFKHYETLDILRNMGYNFYYDIENNEIINKKRAYKLEKNKFKISDKYMIVGNPEFVELIDKLYYQQEENIDDKKENNDNNNNNNNNNMDTKIKKDDIQENNSQQATSNKNVYNVKDDIEKINNQINKMDIQLKIEPFEFNKKNYDIKLYIITGKYTFRIKNQLKNIGSFYNPNKKGWVIKEEDLNKIIEILYNKEMEYAKR